MKFTKYKLEELCSLQIGKTPRREISEYWGKGYSWVSISDMKSPSVASTREEITEKAVKECGCKMVSRGTLLLSFKLSIGKLAFAEKDLFTNEAIVALNIKDPKIILPKYLYYVLKHTPLVGSNNAAMGCTLNKESLKLITIPVPDSINDQLQIADTLSKAESLIAKRKESIRLLDEFLKSTFLEMFGDPVNNKKNFRLLQVADYGESRLGKMLDGKKIIGNNLKPYLRNSNVLWLKFKLDDLLEMDFPDEDKIEYNLRNGDILMCEGGEIGRCAIWRNELEECYFQKAIHRIRLNRNIAVPEYFVYMFWLYTLNGGLNKYKDNATISHLTGEKLKKMKLPFPPVQIQTRFAQIVEQSGTIKAEYQKSLKELENLYSSLSQKAFKGEMGKM